MCSSNCKSDPTVHEVMLELFDGDPRKKINCDDYVVILYFTVCMIAPLLVSLLSREL